MAAQDEKKGFKKPKKGLKGTKAKLTDKKMPKIGKK